LNCPGEISQQGGTFQAVRLSMEEFFVGGGIPMKGRRSSII